MKLARVLLPPLFPAVLVLLTVSPPAAWAAPTRAQVEEARERFNRGVQLYNESSLEAALAEFQKANQLSPSYRLHFNIAQVQYELHDYVEALRSFWKYLAQGGSDVPPQRRAEVEGEIKKLEKRVGYLSIKTSVTGAQISVDGVPMGISPFSAPVLVNPGSRRVSANKAGFIPGNNVVTVAGGERLEVTLQLPPAAGLMDGPSLRARPSPFGSTFSAASARPKTWGSLALTGALGISATVFAFVAQSSENEFEHELTRIPNTRESIEASRDRMTRFAAVTDVLLAATAVAAGVTIFFALTEEAAITVAPGGVGLAAKF